MGGRVMDTYRKAEYKSITIYYTPKYDIYTFSVFIHSTPLRFVKLAEAINYLDGKDAETI